MCFFLHFICRTPSKILFNSIFFYCGVFGCSLLVFRSSRNKSRSSTGNRVAARRYFCNFLRSFLKRPIQKNEKQARGTGDPFQDSFSLPNFNMWLYNDDRYGHRSGWIGRTACRLHPSTWSIHRDRNPISQITPVFLVKLETTDRSLVHHRQGRHLLVSEILPFQFHES